MPVPQPGKRSLIRRVAASRYAAALLVASATPGCAAQLGLGSATGGDDLALRVVTVEARSFAPRKLGPLIGLGGTAVVGGDGRDGAFPRNAFLAAGVHIPSSNPDLPALGGELAFELGAGEPARRDLGGVSPYAGLSAVALLRLVGPDDHEPRFDVLTPLVDLAIAPRCGFWTTPESIGSRLHPEGTFTVALRVTLTSDLAAPRGPKHRTPEAPAGAPGAFQ